MSAEQEIGSRRITMTAQINVSTSSDLIAKSSMSWRFTGCSSKVPARDFVIFMFFLLAPKVMTNFSGPLTVCLPMPTVMLRKNEKWIFNRQINNFLCVYSPHDFSASQSILCHFSLKLVLGEVLALKWRNYLLFTIDFFMSIQQQHTPHRDDSNQKNLLKSILREKINPLINWNRFTIPLFSHNFFLPHQPENSSQLPSQPKEQYARISGMLECC